MAKIVYDDGSEKDFNEEDFISREELSENYVPRELYDKKKKQAKEAFRQKDLAEKASAEADKAELEKAIEEKVFFKNKHGFDEIPEEIISIRDANPNLTWEQAYRVADYHDAGTSNPNPGREKATNIEKTEYSYDELADLAEKNPSAYNEVAKRIESGEIRQI